MIKTVHIHELSDVIFYCIEGDFDIVTDDGIVHLTEGDFVLIAKGTRHRLILTILVKCLLIERRNTEQREYGWNILPDNFKFGELRKLEFKGGIIMCGMTNDL